MICLKVNIFNFIFCPCLLRFLAFRVRNPFSGEIRRSFWGKLRDMYSLTQQDSLFSSNRNKEDLFWVSFNYKPEGRRKGGVIFVSQYDVCDLVLPGGVAVLLLHYNCNFPVAIRIWLGVTFLIWGCLPSSVGALEKANESCICDLNVLPCLSLLQNHKDFLFVWTGVECQVGSCSLAFLF